MTDIEAPANQRLITGGEALLVTGLAAGALIVAGVVKRYREPIIGKIDALRTDVSAALITLLTGDIRQGDAVYASYDQRRVAGESQASDTLQTP